MQKLLAIVAVLLLASAAFAGSSATAYRYSLPGETVVYSTDFTGISIADWSDPANPDANVGLPGFWTQNGIGIFDNVQMNLVQSMLSGVNPEPKGTYTLASAINVKNGPVTLYWTMTCANGTPTVPGDFYVAGGVSDSRGGTGPTGLSGTWREPTHHRIATQIWGSYGSGPAGMTQQAWLPGDGSEGSSDVMITSDAQPALTAYQLSGEPVQYKLVGHKGEAGKMVMQLHYGYTKGAFFSWQPLGPEWDSHPAGDDFVMGVDENGDGIPEAEGVLSRVWMFASKWTGGGVVVDDLELTQAKIGNTDSDDDVDGDDYLNVVNNFGSTAANNESFPAGNIVDNPGNPDLIYDPATGNVILDINDQTCDTYQIKLYIDADFNEAACIQPWKAIYPMGLSDLTAFETFESNPTAVVIAGMSGIKTFNLGNILPAGWDLATLQAHLAEARWSYGTGMSGDLDLIPEPATMILLGIGGLGVMLKRRRA